MVKTFSNDATKCFYQWMLTKEYRLWMEQAEELKKSFISREYRVFKLAEKIEDSLRNEIPTLGEPWKSLLLSSIYSINWRELAEEWVED